MPAQRHLRRRWHAAIENSTTSPLPATAHAQKPACTRWRSIQAATTAVIKGSVAVITAAWPAVTSRSANASSNG